jgi:hypothetical protein
MLNFTLMRVYLVTFFIYYVLITGFRVIRAFFNYIVIYIFYTDFIVFIYSYNRALKSDSTPPYSSAWKPVYRANAET